MVSRMFKFSSRIFFSEEIKAKEDGGERIRLLQDKINEMRKMYSSLKAEVASIDRKRKRLKKKRGLFLFFLDLFIKKASEF
jgi:FtsZ-binding cell division protein ZapB